MNYTMDRFPKRDDKPVVEAVADTMKAVVYASSLDKLLALRAKRKREDKAAKKAMLKMMNLAASAQGEEEEEGFNLLGKALGRILKFVGKQILKRVVRPILTFAGRMAMNIIRIAATTVLRMVIMPIITAIGSAIAAALSPFALGVLAVGAVIAGGVYAWKRWFGEPAVKPKVMVQPGAPTAPMVEEVDTTDVAEMESDVAAGNQAVLETPAGVEAAPAQVAETTVVESVTKTASKAITAVKEFVGVKPKKGGKFTGFGEDVDQYIIETAQRYPILPLDELRGFIKMEAGWTGAMSPTGAIGTGQFIQSTWDSLAKTPAGAAIGMTVIGKRFRKPEDPRFDKRINTLATGLLASQNAAMLVKAGLPVTGTNLYLLHNVGPGIINALLGKPVSDKVQLAISQQGGVFKNATADYYVREMGKRYQQAYADANNKTILQADQPMMAEATTVTPQQKIKAKVTPKNQIVASADKPKSGDLIKGPGKTIVRA